MFYRKCKILSKLREDAEKEGSSSESDLSKSSFEEEAKAADLTTAL